MVTPEPLTPNTITQGNQSYNILDIIVDKPISQATVTDIPVSQTDTFDNFRWFEDTDTANVLNAITSTNTDNTVSGGSTYGFWELLGYLDDAVYNQWIYLAEDCGYGLGAGLLITSFAVRLAFIPLVMYSQMTGVKIKLLQPDQEEITEVMKRHMKSGNKEAATIERQKMKKMRAKNGIYPSLSFLSVAQLPLHIVFISMINRLSYNYDIKPAILTDGFLWFQDLSSPDPYGVLPILGGLITLLNVMSTTTTNINPMMRRMKRYMYLLPFITIPVWMTFPSAFNIYWMTTSAVQLVILNLFRNLKFRQMVGIPKFLPGSKLEKMNQRRKKQIT